jgi:hypothetical protein
MGAWKMLTECSTRSHQMFMRTSILGRYSMYGEGMKALKQFEQIV